MIKKSRTLRRLGLIGVGSVIALGTPVAGLVGTASAAPATVTLYSQHNGTASTLNNGTGTGASTVKLSAVENTPNSSPDPAIASMHFTYAETAPTAGPTTSIGTDNTFPYSINWTPPNNGTFTVTAEPLASGGGSGGTSDSKTVVVNNVDPSVHITSPADGDTIPFTTTGGATPKDYVGVTGTRSNNSTTGLPAISFNTRLYDDTTGTLRSDEVSTDNVVPAVASPGANPDQTWNTAVQIPTDCPAGDTCDVLVDAVASASHSSGADEVVQAQLAASPQTLNVGSFTVTPGTGASSPPNVNGTTGNPTTFTATAKDNNGAPMAGVKVTLTGQTATTTTVTNPASGLTNANGQVTFTVTDTAAESQTLTFQTEVNGSSFVAGNDFSVTRTYVTASATITTITVTKTPEQTNYATQGYDANHPEIDACLFDQNGDPFTGSTSGVTVQVRRSITGGSNSIQAGKLDGPATVDPHSNCYKVDIDTSASPPGAYPASNQSGSDAYDVFVDHNSVPGFQPGSSDVGGTTTVNFAPGAFTFDNYADCTNPGSSCATQAQTGTPDTITAIEKIGGTAVPAGRTLNLQLTSAGAADFPAAQPAGTNRVDDTHATCTTGSGGSCQVNVSDFTADSGVLLQVSEPGAAFNGQISIHFYNHSVAFNKSVRYGHSVLYPCQTASDNTPSYSNNTCHYDYGAPGTILEGSDLVEDSSGDPLADVSVTVTIDHGFFTPRPADSGDYNAYTFDPAAAAGGKAGTPENIGKSLTAFTDSHGRVHFAISIGQDAGFNDDGEVRTTVKVNGVTTLNSSGDTDGNPASGPFQANYTWTTNTDDIIDSQSCSGSSCPSGYHDTIDLGQEVTGGALNGATVTLHKVPGSTLTGTRTSEQETGEDVEIDNGEHASEFYVTLTDQFGNLVGSNTDLTADGPGNGQFTCDEILADQAAQPAAVSDEGELFSSYNDDINSNEEPTCALDVSNDTPTTAANTTVTDSWESQSTVFAADNDPTGPPFVTVATDPAHTDSFSMNLYSVAINRLHYTYHVIPRNTVPTDTVVHDEVTVTDQYAHPVFNLFVSAQQSGPGARDTGAQLRTNQAGTASYNFHSAIQGNSVVTLDVYDCDVNNPSCSGIPISEKRNGINFDAVPSIHLDQHGRHGQKVTIFGHTRQGAKVQLYKKVGHGSFKKSGHARHADNDGSYRFVRHIKKTTKFRVLVDGVRASAHKKAKFKSKH